MTTWPSTVATRWFVAARADRVRAKPLAVTVLGRPLVLVRLASGELLALEDRCPHRQVPLSIGRVTADGLRCPYHGWTFAADGRCTAVPGLADGACLPRAGARPISALELDGLVWVRMASHGDEAPPAMASRPTGSRKFIWQAAWNANVVDAIENFLDPLHTHLVHPGLVRKDGQREPVRVTVSQAGDGFTVDYQGQPRQSGLLYRMFEKPRVSERAHFAGAGSAQLEYRYADGSAVRITLHFTPESNARTHVFGALHIENRWAPAWAVRLLSGPFLKRVAHQDQRILEIQSSNMKRFPPARGVSTELDIVRPMLERIWEQDNGVPGAGNVAYAPGVRTIFL